MEGVARAEGHKPGCSPIEAGIDLVPNRVAKIAKPTGSKLVKRPAESGEICSVEVEEK
jgi:hypothetical protein